MVNPNHLTSVRQQHAKIWPDVIRSIAILLVVALHVSAWYLYRFNRIPMWHWWSGNLIDSLVRPAVPLFYMLSGALLLPKREPVLLFYWKRARKIVIPFLVWSAFYIGWSFYFRSISLDFWGTLSRVATKQTFYHLGFMYVIIQIYILMPMIRAFVHRTTKKTQWKVCLAVLMVASAITVVDRWTAISFNLPKQVSYLLYLGHPLLGYLLSRLKITKRLALMSAIAFAIGVAIAAVGTYALFHSVGQDFFFYNTLAPHVILMSAGAFLLLKRLGQSSSMRSGWWRTGVMAMSRVSFGIYFIHAAMLDLWWKQVLGVDFYQLNPALVMVTLFFLVLISSAVLAEAVRRIPFVRIISP